MRAIKFTLIFFTSILIVLLTTQEAFAIYDPTSLPNNKIGIHILFPDEIFQAKELINSKNGDWGYVTIPIQVSDKNLLKWQIFMDDASELHIIPILRLATNGDYFDTNVWEKPKLDDVLDFANFLNSLDWPTKNRYVVIFNEVNRSNEWGGNVSPSEYAEILNYAVDTFKSKNQDFFVISAGLDNAAPNSLPDYMNEYDFMMQMDQAIPGIFAEIDGIASHSYPNPGFSQPPYINTAKSIYSFRYENNLINRLANKNLPVFITETGWSNNLLSDNKIASFLKEAYIKVWNDKNVVAVTPFLLKAGQGTFAQFSFLNNNGDKNADYKMIEDLDKTKGQPNLTPKTKKETIVQKTLPIRRFFYKIETQNSLLRRLQPTKTLFKWLLNI